VYTGHWIVAACRRCWQGCCCAERGWSVWNVSDIASSENEIANTANSRNERPARSPRNDRQSWRRGWERRPNAGQ